MRSDFSRRSTMPMNFNVIGGGPAGATGATTVPPRGPADAGAGGSGLAFALNRNRFRSVPPGFGRSTDNWLRRTSGASGPALPRPFDGEVRVPVAAAGLAGVADGAVGVLVNDHARYSPPARTTTTVARSN